MKKRTDHFDDNENNVILPEGNAEQEEAKRSGLPRHCAAASVSAPICWC